MNVDPFSAEFLHVVKTLICGDKGVGKSSIIKRLCAEKFNDKERSTIGIDFNTWTFEPTKTHGRVFKLHFFDVSGDSKYTKMIQAHCSETALFIFVYNIHNISSFEHLSLWLEQMMWKRDENNGKYYSSHHPHAVGVLIGNMYDLQHLRTVTKEQGELFASSHGLRYFETSAKTGLNINYEFKQLVAYMDDCDYKLRQKNQKIEDVEIQSLDLGISKVYDYAQSLDNEDDDELGMVDLTPVAREYGKRKWKRQLTSLFSCCK